MRDFKKIPWKRPESPRFHIFWVRIIELRPNMNMDSLHLINLHLSMGPLITKYKWKQCFITVSNWINHWKCCLLPDLPLQVSPSSPPAHICFKFRDRLYVLVYKSLQAWKLNPLISILSLTGLCNSTNEDIVSLLHWNSVIQLVGYCCESICRHTSSGSWKSRNYHRRVIKVFISHIWCEWQANGPYIIRVWYVAC